MATTLANLGAPAPIGNLLIVDGLNIAFRWKHQGVTDFKYDYARTIESLAKSYNAGTIMVGKLLIQGFCIKSLPTMGTIAFHYVVLNYLYSVYLDSSPMQDCMLRCSVVKRSSKIHPALDCNWPKLRTRVGVGDVGL